MKFVGAFKASADIKMWRWMPWTCQLLVLTQNGDLQFVSSNSVDLLVEELGTKHTQQDYKKVWQKLIHCKQFLFHTNINYVLDIQPNLISFDVLWSEFNLSKDSEAVESDVLFNMGLVLTYQDAIEVHQVDIQFT